MKEAGLRHRRPARKIPLTEQHAQARVGFCLEHYNFDWINNNVIFVDEKTFQSHRDGRKILWRRNNERFEVANVLPNRMSGRLSLGYWGWMSIFGPGELVEVSGRMNAEQYVDLLRDIMVPTVRLHHPTGPIFLCQDNCSVHRARIVQEWLQAQPDIHVLPWPAKSPDLNPIENLWGQMVLNWDVSEVRTADNLRSCVVDTWERMRGDPRDMCYNMVSGMRGRLDEVLNANGGPTRY